jgi:hypothetical protein
MTWVVLFGVLVDLRATRPRRAQDGKRTPRMIQAVAMAMATRLSAPGAALIENQVEKVARYFHVEYGCRAFNRSTCRMGIAASRISVGT